MSEQTDRVEPIDPTGEETQQPLGATETDPVAAAAGVEPEEAHGAAPPSEDAAAPAAGQVETEREPAGGFLEELQRERAAFINYKRRTEQERATWGHGATAALIHNILPVLDDFERARASIPPEQASSSWVEGLMHVGRKLESTLELAGLRPIEAVGTAFDPALHEAVSSAPAEDGESGVVLEEFRRGYRLGERVLRPSMVQVSQ